MAANVSIPGCRGKTYFVSGGGAAPFLSPQLAPASKREVGAQSAPRNAARSLKAVLPDAARNRRHKTTSWESRENSLWGTGQAPVTRPVNRSISSSVCTAARQGFWFTDPERLHGYLCLTKFLLPQPLPVIPAEPSFNRNTCHFIFIFKMSLHPVPWEKAAKNA